MNKVDRRLLKARLLVYATVDSPSNLNYQYIVGSNPTGDFEGATPNSIAYYENGKWNFIFPETDGLEVFCIYTQKLLRWDGNSWVSEMSFAIPDNVPWSFLHTITQEEIENKSFDIELLTSDYQYNYGYKYQALFLNGVLQKKEYPYPDFSISGLTTNSTKITVTWSYGFNDMDIKAGDIVILQLLVKYISKR